MKNMLHVYVNNRRARSQDPIKKLAASEVVRAEIVKKFDVALSEQKWEVVSIFAGPSGPPQPTSFVPNYNIVSHDLTIRLVLKYFYHKWHQPLGF